MPQASDELRNIMDKWFGDGIDDYAPRQFLYARGYILTNDWCWKPPARFHTISQEEYTCMLFLVQEWDYGGIIYGKENWDGLFWDTAAYLASREPTNDHVHEPRPFADNE